jgi:hypothetical protein
MPTARLVGGMSKSLLVPAALLSCATSLMGQTTLLNQNFNSGNVPPFGWSESNNGASQGWQADVTGTMALHSDESGWNDNALISPVMDLTTVGLAFVHGVQGQNFSAWREQNLVQVTLDGGLSFQTIGQLSGPDGQGYSFHFDLSTYLGQSAVQLSLRYQGSYANEWFLDHVVVDDQNPPPPAAHWPNLPTAFVSGVAWMEDFDAITAGSLPPHMAVNSVNSYTRLTDLEGWCNVGQLGPSNGAYSSSNALEMGLVPGSMEYHDVSNALIIGLNGAGVMDFHFSFHARQFGEEISPDDGIWVSEDGSNWTLVVGDWVALTGGTLLEGEWRTAHCDLSTAGLDLSGDFYLAIAQQDNYPYKNEDGVGVDQLALDRPVMDAVNLVVSETATLTVENVDPYSLVLPLRSFSDGLTPTAMGLLNLGQPFESLGFLTPDAAGIAQAQFQVPFLAKGLTFYLQALEINGLDARISNLLVEKVTN